MKKTTVHGFTLIELLVVIAIIAMLASVILASLNQARVKSRDARRLSDVKELQNALELYNNDESVYPDTLTDLVPTYITAMPTDPQSAATYHYGPLATVGSSATCNSFHLGTTLEQTGSPSLASKAGATLATDTVANNKGLYKCTAAGASADFDGSATGVFDLIP